MTPDGRATLADMDAIPAVCRIEDLTRYLGVSRRSIQRRRAVHCFPIPELAGLGYPAWSGQDVRSFLERKPLRRK